jgi:DNA polymerase I-like protein with 3'-5' exonuclease and polymerase domains
MAVIMTVKKWKNKHHIGGEQITMFPPDSFWTPPTELPDLRQHKLIALDRETRDDGLNKNMGPGWALGNNWGYVCGVSIAWKEDGQRFGALYLPVNHPGTECFTKEQIRQWEVDHQKAGVTFVMQNAPYDIGWGKADLDVPIPANIHDTACMAYMLDENRLTYNLDDLCKWQGIPGKREELLLEAAQAFGLDPKQHIYKMPAKYVGPYAEQDARATLMLFHQLEEKLKAENVWEAYRLEMDLVPMVHAMRMKGILMDEKAMDRAYAKFKKESQDALDQLSDKLSMTVTMDEVRSNKWLTNVFDKVHISYPIDPDTNHNSFQAKWMKLNPHWLPQLLVRAKSRDEAAEKFIGTYLQKFVVNGRIHASANQFKSEEGGGTRTYRFSYDNPPLQQAPHRDEEMAKEFRGCFLPEKGQAWASVDYSQQEYRLIVHYAMSLGLRKADEAGQRYIQEPKTDFHQMVADMTGLRRKEAKDANFAKSYGAGVMKFAAMINKSEDEARNIMAQYDEKLPFTRELYLECQYRAEQNGYIKLLDGARSRFNYWVASWREHGVAWTKNNFMADCSREEAERRVANPDHPWYHKPLRRSRCNKAMNSLIQGGAARQTKLAMRACWKEGFTPLLQVHDELDFSINSEKEGIKIAEIMRDVVKLKVPMLVDVEYGKSWGHAVNTWINRKETK